MKKIKLSGELGAGKYAIVDDDDFERCSKFVWCCSSGGYAVSNFGLRMHVLIMQPKHGLAIDHINHNKLDNRRENLRVCSVYENNQNKARKLSKDLDLPDYVYRYYVKGRFRGYTFRCSRGGTTRQKNGFKTVTEAVKYRDDLFKSLEFA